jgi:hypothetical protein
MLKSESYINCDIDGDETNVMIGNQFITRVDCDSDEVNSLPPNNQYLVDDRDFLKTEFESELDYQVIMMEYSRRGFNIKDDHTNFIQSPWTKDRREQVAPVKIMVNNPNKALITYSNISSYNYVFMIWICYILNYDLQEIDQLKCNLFFQDDILSKLLNIYSPLFHQFI